MLSDGLRCSALAVQSTLQDEKDKVSCRVQCGKGGQHEGLTGWGHRRGREGASARAAAGDLKRTAKGTGTPVAAGGEGCEERAAKSEGPEGEVRVSFASSSSSNSCSGASRAFRASRPDHKRTAGQR